MAGYIDRQDYRHRVQVYVGRGAEWLDQHMHPSWRNRIDLDEFDMMNPCRCVLGQVFGNYWDALNDLVDDDVRGLHDEWSAEHGFNVSEEDQTDLDDTAWGILEVAWVNYLNDTRTVSA